MKKRNIPGLLDLLKTDIESEQEAINADISERKLAEATQDEESAEDVCPICLEEIPEKEMKVLDCNHEYHNSCIEEWMRYNPRCPECRAYIKLMEEFPPLPVK